MNARSTLDSLPESPGAALGTAAVIGFAQDLLAGLRVAGFEPYLDTHDIAAIRCSASAGSEAVLTARTTGAGKSVLSTRPAYFHNPSNLRPDTRV
jgi:hypothetical protein